MSMNRNLIRWLVSAVTILGVMSFAASPVGAQCEVDSSPPEVTVGRAVVEVPLTHGWIQRSVAELCEISWVDECAAPEAALHGINLLESLSGESIGGAPGAFESGGIVADWHNLYLNVDPSLVGPRAYRIRYAVIDQAWNWAFAECEIRVVAAEACGGETGVPCPGEERCDNDTHPPSVSVGAQVVEVELGDEPGAVTLGVRDVCELEWTDGCTAPGTFIHGINRLESLSGELIGGGPGAYVSAGITAEWHHVTLDLDPDGVGERAYRIVYAVIDTAQNWSYVECELRVVAPPPPDLCDGVDNDGDGEIDEDFASAVTQCGFGECAAVGETLCVDGALVDTCAAGEPGLERCNELDDDCDGELDEGCASQRFSAGSGFTCQLRDDDHVVCWGADDEGESSGPEGALSHVSAGQDMTCGIRQDGNVQCWGARPETTPEIALLQVDVGLRSACGVGLDGEAVCWGSNASAELRSPPPGPFVAVTNGNRHACALRPDGRAVCWGRASFGSIEPPPGEFAQLSAGAFHTCAIRADDGEIDCWGADGGGRLEAPAGRFSRIGAASTQTCAIRADDGSLACWGTGQLGEVDPPAGVFTEISGGSGHACARRDDDRVICWGVGSRGELFPPTGTAYASYDAGVAAACGIRADDGMLECWGQTVDGIATSPPPGGSWTEVSTGTAYACALDEVGEITCWGEDRVGRLDAPTGAYVQISTGDDLACARSNDGAVSCWGDPLSSTIAEPIDDAERVVAGPSHACAIRTGGELTCWGRDSGFLGLEEAPPAVYVDVGAGVEMTVAVDAAGDLHYWGGDLFLLAYGLPERPPSGFWRVGVGGDFVCALDNTGRAHCTGAGIGDHSRVPDDAFVDLSVGGGYACGHFADGQVQCWGSLYRRGTVSSSP